MKYRRGTNQYQAKRQDPTKQWLFIFTIIVMLVSLHPFFQLVEKVSAFNIVSPIPEESIIREPYPVYFNDERIAKLQSFLEEKNSPLAEYAGLIVKVSDENGIDYTLIPSISGKESSFGKAIREGSHNAWGVMAWDENGKRYIRMFDSWEEGITYEAKLLGKNYKDNMLKGIQETYCPSYECSNTWVSDVESFSKEILN